MTVAADSPDLLELTGRIFADWLTHALTGLLERCELAHNDAETFAVALIASCEGAVMVSRAERSIEAFDGVASFCLTRPPAK